MTFTGADLMAAGASGMALFGSLLLLAFLSRARPDLLISPGGWRLVAAALLLLCLRSLAHFTQAPAIETGRHLAGIGAALLLPSGLYLILRAGNELEVEPDGAQP